LRHLEGEGLIEGEERHGRREFHLTEAGRAYVQIHRHALGVSWDAAIETASEELLEMRDYLEQVAEALEHIVEAGTASQVTEASRLLANTRRALYLLLADDDSL
jgi:DNA-binding PadR family transcriptional regulator